MRVALICPYDLQREGGVQLQVLLLARHLKKRGVEVLLVAPGEAPREDAAGIFISAGPPVLLPANSSRAPLAFNPLKVRAALRKLEASEAEVIHVHEPFAPLLGIFSWYLTNVPLAATFHRSGVDLLYKAVGAAGKRTFKKRCRYAAAVSSLARQTAESALGLTPEVLFNAIDLSEFPEIKKDPKGPLRVLFVGRHEPRKGLEVLLKAWRAQEGKLVGKAELVVAGSGPLTDELKERYSISTIRWVGRLPRGELLALYATSHVCVVPSLTGESFGLTVLEAMAAGCCVIASDLTSYREVAKEGALYFPVGDWKSLGALLVDLVREPAHALGLGEQARKLAAAYDVERLTDIYLGKYKLLAGVTGSGPL